MTTLEDRIARLEAIEDIRQLKARYCAYGDRLIPLDDVHTIFTADAVWDGGKAGRHEGRDAIVAYFQQQVPAMLFSAHLLANPIIEVQGGTARAQWWSITPATRLRDGKQQAYWMLGSYDDLLVRQDGRWLFSAVNFRISFVAPHATGWAES
jgi:hypothetical protein